MTIHITPDIWGPKLWMSIHFIALAYPISPTDEHKKNYKTFYESLQYVLPCSLCANNYKEHLKIKPLNDSVLKDKESLVKWTIDMHNLVNKDNNKEVLSYDKAIDLILNNFKYVESDIKKENDKNLSSIQNNLIEKPKEKETPKEKEIPKKYNKNLDYNYDIKIKSNKKTINIDEEESKTSIFMSFTFWFFIFSALVSIAILYKKHY
jgi:hypothetical protein